MVEWLEHPYHIHNGNNDKGQLVMAEWLEHPYHIHNGNNDKGQLVMAEWLEHPYHMHSVKKWLRRSTSWLSG